MKKTLNLFRAILASGLLLVSAGLEAKVITGTVKDQTGETVISASVVVKGTTIGTVTDFDGNYTIDVPDDAKTLVFSYIGLVTQELPIKGDVLNVTLSENSEVLEEVVVTGYGTTKKRDLVTSVASVSADQLKDIPVTSAAEALQGKLSGVNVVTTDGSPDADVKIRVRGGTSLTQSSDPLYIVDGFPVSSISDIAPGDIASMDVLKDAAATAIYGAQGANGVIIITTKDVKSDDSDKMKIHADYTGYVGWKKMAKKYDMMDVNDFVLMQYEAARLIKGKSGMNSAFYEYFDPIYSQTKQVEDQLSLEEIQTYWAGEKHTDWQDETFGRTGMQSNHNISISGGNKLATFNLNYARIDDKGIMYGSNYSRNNIGLKAKFKPINEKNHKLTISFNARFSNTNVLGSGANTSEDKGSTSESRVRNAIAYSPISLLSQSSSTDPDYEAFGSLYDPITTIDHNYKTKKDNKLQLDGYVQYQLFKDFTLKADIGYENRDVAQDRFYGPTTYYSGPNGTAKAYAGEAYMGNAVSADNKTTRLREVFTFAYEHKWNNAHNFSALLGQELNIYKGENRTVASYGFDKSFSGEDVFKHLGQARTATITNVVAPTDNMISAFARLNYDYKGRYYATFTFRADGSSRFSEGHQWGYFPSAALAWRMIDEEFMEPAQEVMSNLKIRASYGTVGNNNVDLGYIRSEYLSNDMVYMEGFTTKLTDGGSKSIAANPDLKWETTITRDLGVDMGFFNERLTATIDGYCNSTKDLILLQKMAAGGYSYQYRNIGSTRNMGVEASVTGVILDHKSKNLSYGLTVNANVSHNKNKVVSLGGQDSYTASSDCFSANYMNRDYEFLVKEGSPVGNIYGYRSDGWYTAADFDAYDKTGDRWLKLNEDGKLAEVTTGMGTARPGMTKLASEEKVLLGNTQPVISGGFGINWYVAGEKWGKVDFSSQFTYSYGNDVVNLSALDYSTIFEKTVYRNCTQDIAYGNRYSYFLPSGNSVTDFYETTVVPGSQVEGARASQSFDMVIDGEYAAMANELGDRNSGAKSANPVSGNIALTDKYIEDASYLRLSSLTIGYALPTNILARAHISNLRIFFSASNLFCATKYSGADPEVDTRSKNNPLTPGIDFSAFPKSRAFNFGLNLSF